MNATIWTNAKTETKARPAKSVAELLSAPKTQTAQRKPARQGCSDLLSILLDKYGIDADEFLAASQD